MAPARRPTPLPADFTLQFSPALRRPKPTVVIGGAPLRVLRLTEAGATQIGRWQDGAPVGAGRGAGLVAARMVESGLAVGVPPHSSSSAPSVSVVIPVRDDQPGLDATLSALASTAPDVEVVVVDDGSSPSLAGPVSPRVRVIRRELSGGPAAARNAGWRAAGPVDVIAFVDAGCVPSPGWLRSLLAHFADPGLAAAAPRVSACPAPGTPTALARHEAAASPLDMGPLPGVVGPGAVVSYVPSALLLVRRSDLVAAGGFDETMRFGEDVDLVWRLRAAGRRVVYWPAATAVHPARPSWGRWLHQRYDYGSSAADLAARHGRAVAPLAVSPWSTAVWGLAATGHPVAGAGLLAGSAVALARRGGSDAEVRRELGRLAVAGTVHSGYWLAKAVRRAWLLPALAAAGVGWRRPGGRWRVGVLALAIAAGPDARRGTVGVGLADDLAYQTGVWSGVLRTRSIGALLPRW